MTLYSCVHKGEVIGRYENEISSVTLVPMCFYLDGGGVSGIARDCDLQISTDGEIWTTIASATSESATESDSTAENGCASAMGLGAGLLALIASAVFALRKKED